MRMIKLFSSILLITIPYSIEAATFRWVDKEGETHYSNSVPASDAQLGHVELSKAGMEKKVVLSAKKQRKIKLETEIKRNKRLADKKEKKRLEKQEEEDIRLLSIFNSEEEVVQAYNAKLRMAQLTIDLLKSRHKAQSEKLEKLETRFEYSKDINQKQAIETKMDDVLDNLRIYQQAITENHIEKEKVRKDFQNTLEHYKLLVTKKKTSAKGNE